MRKAVSLTNPMWVNEDSLLRAFNIWLVNVEKVPYALRLRDSFPQTFASLHQALHTLNGRTALSVNNLYVLGLPSSGFLTNFTPSSSNLLQAAFTSGTAMPM